MATVMDTFRTERAAVSSNGHRARRERTPILAHFGRAATATARFAARRLPRWHAVRTAIMSTTGFGLLTAAAWQLHLVAGLAAAGVSLLILEALNAGGGGGDGRR